jgi:flagellar protein FliO/FliZ
LPVQALLLCGVGLFIQMPMISAQEELAQEALSQAEDTLLAVEQSLTLGEGNPLLAGAASGPSVWSIVRMLLTLALAAAAVYGVVFFIKKGIRRNDLKDPFLKVLAVAHLGSNRYVHICAVGSKAWLLGSSDGGVNLIGEIDDKDILNAMLLEESQKSAEATSGRFIDFKSILRRLGVPADPRAPGAETIRKRRERLKGL